MKVSIVGGGLVGSLWSIYLSNFNYEVTVFEKRKDIRLTKIDSGRSINLALSYRGIMSLKQAGVYDKIKNLTMPMYGRFIHNVNGKITYQRYGKYNEAIYSISRRDLNIALIKLAESKGVKIFFNYKCKGIDFKNNILKFGKEHFQSDIIFGADGSRSFIRSKINNKLDSFKEEKSNIQDGYKEIYLPANNNGSYKLNKDVLHIWPRGKFMLIALPNLGGSFTCTLFMPISDGKNSFKELDTKEKIKAFFKKIFPDFYNLFPEFISSWDDCSISKLEFVKCYPWSFLNTLIMGDAAHAVVPFYGQGMNSGFEDCEILYDLILSQNHDWKSIINNFQKERKIDTDAILKLSLSNYYVMRDYVTDQKFLLQKKIENHFAKKHPEKWNPLYSMVTFSKIPYSIAYSLGEKQNKIMKSVMRINNIKDIWDSQEVENFILKKIKD